MQNENYKLDLQSLLQLIVVVYVVSKILQKKT